ncbi:MAG: protease inhibitor I42 family protein [Spirochaetales bacterium]|nr:protease inhibitor I42 family protein [Spirochaetales bacterium]
MKLLGINLVFLTLLMFASCKAPTSSAPTNISDLNAEISSYTSGSKQISAGTLQNVAVGDQLYVRLNSLGSDGGYWWYYTISDPTIVQTVDENTFLTNTDPGVAGAGVVYVVKFKILKSGNTTIEFNDYRSWEGIQDSIANQSFNLVAQ